MASKKSKKVVSQDQLRRLMRQKQFSATTDTNKIDHPLAKYNSLEQLVCTLCNTVIKNNNLWLPHIQSSKHKEKYIASKTQGPAKPVDVRSGKRKLTDAEILAVKKAKPNEITSASNGKKSSDQAAAGRVSSLAEYSSSSGSSSEDEDKETTKTSAAQSSAGSGKGLPADFFDPGVKVEEDKVESSKPATMAETLPEGFFDDPKMDAKVRQVEYKDKMEEEWELFQKSMKEEAHVSEAIVEEDDEQANVERNLDEIDDQMQRWQEVEELHVKKETIAKTTGDDDGGDRDSEELDDEDLDQFLDWRSKKSWK